MDMFGQVTASFKDLNDPSIPATSRRQPMNGSEYHFREDRPPQVITHGVSDANAGILDFAPAKVSKPVEGGHEVDCDYVMRATTTSGEVYVPMFYWLQTLAAGAYINTATVDGEDTGHHIFILLPTNGGENIVYHIPPGASTGDTTAVLTGHIRSVLSGSAGQAHEILQQIVDRGSPARKHRHDQGQVREVEYEGHAAATPTEGGLIDMDSEGAGVGLLSAARRIYLEIRSNRTRAGLQIGVAGATAKIAEVFNPAIAHDPRLGRAAIRATKHDIERDRLRDLILHADLPQLRKICGLFARTIAKSPLAQSSLAAISAHTGEFQQVTGAAILPPEIKGLIDGVVAGRLADEILDADGQLVRQRGRLMALEREIKDATEQADRARRELEGLKAAHEATMAEVEKEGLRQAARVEEKRKDTEERLRQAIAENKKAIQACDREIAWLDRVLADRRAALQDKYKEERGSRPKGELDFEPLVVTPSRRAVITKLIGYAYEGAQKFGLRAHTLRLLDAINHSSSSTKFPCIPAETILRALNTINMAQAILIVNLIIEHSQDRSVIDVAQKYRSLMVETYSPLGLEELIDRDIPGITEAEKYAFACTFEPRETPLVDLDPRAPLFLYRLIRM
jgi:hypothetical protein